MKLFTTEFVLIVNDSFSRYCVWYTNGEVSYLTYQCKWI